MFPAVWISATIVLALSNAVQGQIKCYECTSWTDPLCSDPFNFTLPLEKQPPTEECDGCCVKLVQHIGTPYASVRRTCTDKMRIKLFVVDRVCMREGDGRGHMCFCEEDLCNAAPPSMVSFLFPRISPSSRRSSSDSLLGGIQPSLVVSNLISTLSSYSMHCFKLLVSLESAVESGIKYWAGPLLDCMNSRILSFLRYVLSFTFIPDSRFSLWVCSLTKTLMNYCLFVWMIISPYLISMINGFVISLSSCASSCGQILGLMVTWPASVAILLSFHRLVDWNRDLR